jgi:putative sterol carrier protein
MEEYLKLVEERKKTQKKPYLLFTPEWIAEFEKKIQEDQEYQRVAKTWEGSVVLWIKEEPGILLFDLFIFMDLWHGQCQGVRLVGEEQAKKGDFVLQAEYLRWKRILKKELNVVKEIVTGKLKLVPFDFKKAARLAAAAQAALRLVDLAGQVGARFPDEIDKEELQEFQALFKKLKKDFGI